jgi:hypothetical protein
MKNLSNNVLNALDQEVIQFNILVELLFNSTYRFTDASHNISFNGNVYLADSPLYSYDPPVTTTFLGRETYRIGLVDHNHVFQNEAKTGVNGRRVNVYAAIKDSTGSLLLNPADIIVVYKGFVDRLSFSNDFKDKLCFVEAASPVAKLDKVKPIITSKEDMAHYDPLDTSYDQIYKDSEITVKWGKK